MMGTVLQDVRHTLRMLRNNPGFTAIAVLTLALGIGANTAIFSIVKAVVLRPLPFAESNQLYNLWTFLPDFGREAASLPDYKDWRDQNTVFEQVAAYRSGSSNLASSGEPERVSFMAATPNLFSLLKLQPVIGRLLVEDDDRPGAPKVVVLSNGFWQRKFGGKKEALGQTVTMNTTSYTVVGVAPPEMQMFNRAELVIAMGLTPAQIERLGRRNDFLNVIGRAKPGVSKQQIDAEMGGIAGRLDKQYPNTNKGVGIQVSSLQLDLVGNMRPILLSLWAAVGFMLLIVCVNMANLMLARGAAREKEMAVRAALGARSGRLIRQLLTEGVVLAIVGAVVGVLLAYWGIDAALALAPKDVPFVSRVGVDRDVLGFAALLALGTGLIFALIPALHGGRVDLNATLKEGGRTTSSVRHALRSALVISEVALSLILLAGAGLMIRTLHELQNTATGFDADHVLTFRVSLPPGRYNDAQQAAFFERLLSELRAKPGVKAAGATSTLYVHQEPSYLTFTLQGAPPRPVGEGIDAQVRTITPQYMETMQVPLLQGRQITDGDRAGGKNVAVINQALIDRHFPGQQLIGRSVSVGGDQGPWFEVVGVIGNVKQRGADREVYPEIDIPLAQSPNPAMTIALRTATDPTSLVSTARGTVNGLDPSLPVFDIQTMDDVLAESRAGASFQARVLSVFAMLALLLAAVGIYGVMAQSVAQRTSEFGVRLALGAHPSQVLRLVLGQGMRLAAIGLAFGIAGALILTRFLRSFLFGVSAYDPLTLAAVSLVLAGIAALACYIPARRAMKVDPMVALRYE
jgi:putative ABC transport system permease protein